MQAHKVRDLRRQIQLKLRPNAISLVDSWAFTDYELHSALGRQDGDVYRALLSMAKGSPLNRTDEGVVSKRLLMFLHLHWPPPACDRSFSIVLYPRVNSI